MVAVEAEVFRDDREGRWGAGREGRGKGESI